jgi:alcohol dehydrogenase class IV
VIEQRVLSFDDVRRLNPRTTCIWATPSVVERVEATLAIPVLRSFQPLPATVRTLLVIGGGTLIDKVKIWRTVHAPELELIAVSSIWGSGAEASPIAVQNLGTCKEIRVDERLLPNARAVWPEIAASVTSARARFGCGDCWAHALEGFLSPLADEPLRAELASLMAGMLVTPMSDFAAWFEFSANAAAGQAKSSVGLVHGIAHTLEGALRMRSPEDDWGHARLCSLFLWPVMRFNAAASGRSSELLHFHCFSCENIFAALQEFFDDAAYDQVLPALRENWRRVLLDPCSRTNCALVRPSSLVYFESKAFR